MGEHLVVCVDSLTKPESSQGSEISRSSSDPSDSVIDINEEDENLPLLQNMECRICQEEDSIKNLETPCACNGSLKFAHRKCVQRWCNEKGDTTCEICHHIYQPGYTAPPPRPESATIDINGSWIINGAPVDIHDPRLLAMATAEHQLLEADYDEYNDSDATGAAFCRSAALILMALLLLRHAISIGNENGDDDEDDATTFFSLFLLRAAGFLLPCYIMAWAISIMQRRRQRQEEAAEVAFMLRLAQQAALQSAVSSGATTEVDNVTTQGEGQEGQVNVTHPLPVQ